MARCNRCNRFMFFSRKCGYCRKCEGMVEKEKINEKLKCEETAKIIGDEEFHIESKENSETGNSSRSSTNRKGVNSVCVNNTYTGSKSDNKQGNVTTKYITDEGYALSDEQAAVYEQLESTQNNYFVTGKAGTGKSVVLRYFIGHTKKKFAVIAPTGIAAINVKGQTIHSFFGLKSTIQDVTNSGQTALSTKQQKMLNVLDTIIIDEISMVRSDVMDMIDKKLRIAKDRNKPFGGCQMIVFGDLYQLPPVVEKDKIAQRFLNENYGSEFFFAAPGVKNHPFIMIELQKVYRQNDKAFIDMLNAIRRGECSAEILRLINKRNITMPEDCLAISLTPTRRAADSLNQKRLSCLNTDEHLYHGTITGEFRIEETPTDVDLYLKEGAHVMMIKNDPAERWVNGTAGIIEELANDQIKVRIKGLVYSIDKVKWTKFAYFYNEATHKLEQIEVGSFEQFPIKLAYAITIHKSQGQTYDQVRIDYSMGRAFAPGQTYVALSRCKSLEGLYLEDDLKTEDIKVNQEVIHYMRTSGNPVY